ncbi:hypothetical protein K439DRAFT_1632848 [Ramaria rubella]|nr:hypothetical protein K439DRAFT_1632848 [Ramaria rubella]
MDTQRCTITCKSRLCGFSLLFFPTRASVQVLHPPVSHNAFDRYIAVLLKAVHPCTGRNIRNNIDAQCHFPRGNSWRIPREGSFSFANLGSVDVSPPGIKIWMKL